MKIFDIRIYLFLVFVCGTYVNVFSQEDYEARYESMEEEYEPNDLYLNLFEFSLSNQIPLETFRKNLLGTSIGFRLAYYNNFSGKDNLFWSLHYQSFRLAKLSNSYVVNEQFATYLLDSKAITNVIFVAYGVRYYFDAYTDKFEPFADLKLGFNNVYTYSSDTIEGSEEANLDIENWDTSFAYSVGAGVQYNVRKGQAIHLMANFNSGNNSTYYVEDNKGQDYPWENFDKKTTQLDYIQIFFGITFGF